MAKHKSIPAGAYYSKTLVQLDSAIKIKVPGYLYIYLSYENESNNYVYFDDLKINYQKSQIVQSNNYYAFGLQTKDSWTRMDTKPNQYLYNAGSELNEATSNYEMMFRSYDPAIGRMGGVDPMVDKYASMTPYNYSMNDPIYYNDPSGAEYEWASMGGCGCWKDKGAQDGGGQSNGMYGSNWNAATYGTGFAKYGPGDGGALDNLGDAAAARLKLKQWINDGLIVSVTDQSQIATLVNAHKAGAGITLGSNGFWTHTEGFYRSSITGVELGTFTQDTYYRIQGQNNGNGLSGDPGWDLGSFAYANGAALVLLGDDVTGIGAVDDIAIPVIYVGAAAIFVYQNKDQIGRTITDTYQLLSNVFKGGKQSNRDRDYGLPAGLWDWYHNGGGKEQNGDRDIGREPGKLDPKEALDQWEGLGKPGGSKPKGWKHRN